MRLLKAGFFLSFCMSGMSAIAASTVIAKETANAEKNLQQIKAFEQGVVSRWEFGRNSPQQHSIESRLRAHQVPGAAVGIIKNGKVVHAKGYGQRMVNKDTPVDANTLFSVGSVSKMANAALILKLVEEKQLDLDSEVNQYLKSWKVPQNRYTRKLPVTLRTILSHSAGFNIHGFADFQPGARLPSVLDTLYGRSPALHRPVLVTFLPGSAMDYSGGGITVSQLVATDKTGLNYPELTRRLVFAPLNMNRSTFQNPLPAFTKNVAHAHDEDGRPATRERGWEAMPEMAASGLWTSASDLAGFVVALIQSYRSNHGFIEQSLAQDMMNRENNSWYGLGPRINGEGETLVFHHGGANNSYRAWIEGHLTTGDGIVVLTNGTNGHFIHQEIRRAAQQAFGWQIKSDGGFEEPVL